MAARIPAANAAEREPVSSNASSDRPSTPSRPKKPVAWKRAASPNASAKMAIHKGCRGRGRNAWSPRVGDGPGSGPAELRGAESSEAPAR